MGKVMPMFCACSWPRTFVVSTKEALTPAALARRCTNSATRLKPNLLPTRGTQVLLLNSFTFQSHLLVDLGCYSMTS